MTEGPYKLPKGWRWVKLGEMFVLRNGKFIRKSRLGNSGGIRVYGSNGLIGCTGGIEPIIHTDTIVIGRVGACGAVNIALAPAWVSDNAMYVYEWLTDCDLSYIALALRHSNLGAFPKQGAQPSISQAEVYQKSIPLPPLEEQRRIVARIEELMERIREARHLRQKAREDTERLWQATLFDVFPRPGTALPPGWRWVKLGEMCEHRTGVWGPEASSPARGFPIVRSTEIDGMFIRPETASVREVQKNRLNSYTLESGDILVNKSSGSSRLVGWPALFKDPKDGRMYLFSNFMLRLRPKRNILISHFLLYYLHSPIARSIYLGAQDTTSGLRNLRVRDFMNQPIPLPPLEEQRRIVARIEESRRRSNPSKKARLRLKQASAPQQSILMPFRGIVASGASY